jgi:D-sedoheptulose 7-phosphate isomerase
MNKSQSDHTSKFFSIVKQISENLDYTIIESLVESLITLRTNGGRLFFLGVGGSAANCSHAVNDFRKLCGIETYAPTDNVSELTARINDEGWEGALVGWLKVSKLNEKDGIFILSVGGGDKEKNVSVNLIKAMDYAKETNSIILGIVGRDGGYAKKISNNVVVIPNSAENLVTPLAESFQSLVWHCLVSHPKLQINSTKW